MTNPIPDGLVNLRDLGGLPTDDGGVTRSCVVYRSDAPYAGDRVPEGVDQWPPAVVVDLRDAVEHGPMAHPLSEVAQVHHVPLLDDVRAQAAEGESWYTLSELYQHMLDRATKKLVEVFRIALDADGPMLVHCAAGKDRTGVVSALLLGVVGVRFDSIVADYVRTDRNMEQVLRRLNLEPQLPPGVDEKDVEELVSAPASAIEEVVSRFAENEGGAAGWLCANGVTEAELTRWRERFTGEF
ncbi:tyrosine-protein phosphatase [Parasphingorhabdus pacifica]